MACLHACARAATERVFRLSLRGRGAAAQCSGGSPTVPTPPFPLVLKNPPFYRTRSKKAVEMHRIRPHGPRSFSSEVFTHGRLLPSLSLFLYSKKKKLARDSSLGFFFHFEILSYSLRSLSFVVPALTHADWDSRPSNSTRAGIDLRAERHRVFLRTSTLFPPGHPDSRRSHSVGHSLIEILETAISERVDGSRDSSGVG